MILADVSVFWMLLRIIYAYPQMAPIRNDLFLFLGPWHNYHYGTIAVWMEFRSTFLGPAFFALFPNDLLKYRMSLSKSAVIFQWLRRAYPHFRDNLKQKISTVKKELINFDMNLHLQCHKNNRPLRSKVYSKYIHLSNLLYLFEYVLPTVLDYGILLKSNDYVGFRKSLLRLMRFYFTCEQKGIMYRNLMFCCRCSPISESAIRILQLPATLGETCVTAICITWLYAPVSIGRNGGNSSEYVNFAIACSCSVRSRTDEENMADIETNRGF